MKRIRRNAKTIRPEPAEYFLPREGLVQKLSRSGKKLMILSAPSGYGKTALMELYARSSEAPSVWYRLDGNDNTAALFLESFTVSLEAAVSGFPGIRNRYKGCRGWSILWKRMIFIRG